MVAPIPPPVTPPPEKSKSWSQRFNVGTFVFILFMLLIGSALLVSKLTGFNLNSPTPTPLASRVITATVEATVVRPTHTPPTPTLDLTIKVYITGEVVKPDVYVMRSGDRIEDVINLAGGFTETADKTHLDLAQRVKDEMHIVIPAQITPGSAPPDGGVTLPAGGASQLGSGKVNATTNPVPGKINLNTAGQAELDSLPGIGEVLSQRIFEYRAKNGSFKTLEDLRKVQGVTKATLDKIRDLVTL
jgi:competence protein ComEA